VPSLSVSVSGPEGPTDDFGAWFEALEARHRQSLTFAEIRRALQALSSLYVERRGRLGAGAALESAGKRAAFALYYGPLHFLLVREIVRAVGAGAHPLARLLDLGCGTGTAGAAWALELEKAPCVEAIDRSGWATSEARWTLRAFGLRGDTSRADLLSVPCPRPPAGYLAAFTVNELDDAGRASLLVRLREAAKGGASVLIVEPISRRIAPWWSAWSAAFRELGGRADEWRFRVPLPETLRLLDRAAGLDHRELRGRSLYVGSRPTPSASATRLM
jgi:hypothetical protein